MRFLSTFIFISALSYSALSEAASLSEWSSCFRDGYSKQLSCAELSLDDGAVLAVTRKAAVKLGDTKPPIFVLAGGPGQASSELVSLIDAAFGPSNQYHDLYFVDRRATGRSNPWQCELDETVVTEAQIANEVQRCFERSVWPLDQLNSQTSIDDLEALRTLIGADTVNLWGGSWGTRFALLYAQRYPNSVNRMVLDGVAPVSQPVLITAEAAQGAWDELVLLCHANDECLRRFPNPTTQLNQLLASVGDGITISVFDAARGEQVQQTLSRSQVAQVIRGLLYMPEISGQLFYVVDQAQRGNWQPLVSLGTSQNSAAESMYIGLTLSVLCSEELPRVSRTAFDEEFNKGFVGQSWLEFWQLACAHWPTATYGYDEPTLLDHPTLLISGALDPVTPPNYAGLSAQRLANALEIVLPYGGHMNSMRGCMPTQIGRFFEAKDEEINTDCLKGLPPPLFMTNAFGSQLGGGLDND
ncbi:alpha/beta fold hydrolase [Umboniibacter marinipuniceus]|uniref:Proline iminopeptidase n=1 Tax=Umboniibacter marinipuniceus TaxID=569599 RepID=A0A3M0AK27_9GAMM|nr:alpha/beta hydrolase [Umboniibacter marinipuniceus]RMA79412.1 TAP-like protein [Umboniibacter marinipuniceus]